MKNLASKKLIDGDLYCTVYVDADIGKPGFVIMISDFLDGEIFLRDIESKYLSIFVMKNEDYDPILKDKGQRGAFVYYHYYIDIDPAAEGVDYKTFIEHVKALNKFLRSKGFKTVVVSDSEEDFNE
jgi:hypothetical protein